MPLPLSPLGACLAILALWGLIGVLGLLRPSSVTLAGRTLFPVGALCGIALAVIAGLSLGLDPQEAVLVIGLPDLPMHLINMYVTTGARAAIAARLAALLRQAYGVAECLAAE